MPHRGTHWTKRLQKELEEAKQELANYKTEQMLAE